MEIIAKAHILYNSVTYKPGDRMPNNNPEMIKAWKKAGTVEVIEDKKKPHGKNNGSGRNKRGSSNTPASTAKNFSPESKSTKIENDVPDNGEPEGSNNDGDTTEFYTKEQLDKLSSKAAIVEYAESIGLPSLDTSLHKPEIIDKVLTYIEEVKKDDDV